MFYIDPRENAETIFNSLGFANWISLWPCAPLDARAFYLTRGASFIDTFYHGLYTEQTQHTLAMAPHLGG